MPFWMIINFVLCTVLTFFVAKSFSTQWWEYLAPTILFAFVNIFSLISGADQQQDRKLGPERSANRLARTSETVQQIPSHSYDSAADRSRVFGFWGNLTAERLGH